MGELSVYMKQKRRVLCLLVLGGGISFAGVKLLHKQVKAFQLVQRALCDTSHTSSPPLLKSPKPKIAVDSIFVRRLVEILKICIPSIWSKEACQVVLQTCLLYSRTLLTERIAHVEGKTGQAVVSKEWSEFTSNVVNFGHAAIPAAIVNSGLKYMQTAISLSFQQRLTEHLHQCYLSNRVYYAASVLGGLSNPDQRITEDVAKFSSATSELYSYTFKPVLDVVFFTRSLANTIGYKGQFLLYSYFVLCSIFLRAISPPLSLMATQEAALSGNFRNAHQRIVSHAEEIAFNDPPGGDTERRILNDHLRKLMQHSRLSAFQRFLQQVADGYLVKYTASIVGLCVFAAPFYFSEKRDSLLSTGEYIRAMRLMMNTSKAIGQLVLIYKRVTSLAAFTSRVSELLESVKQLSTGYSWINASSPGKLQLVAFDKTDFVYTPPKIILSDTIEFQNVTLHTPDGMLLVRELSFKVVPGQSVIVMGPNGSGKSSLFRVLAELWPLQSGIIKTPPRQDIFYLSQRPYVVQGTLRDQVRYPAIPANLSKCRRESQQCLNSIVQTEACDDAHIMESLHATELGYLLQRGDGLDQLQNWEETLSGGEKQRLAVSRLLYNNPKFAVLDECTSAVSADGEEKLYKQLHRSGITMLSIAHRPALKKIAPIKAVWLRRWDWFHKPIHAVAHLLHPLWRNEEQFEDEELEAGFMNYMRRVIGNDVAMLSRIENDLLAFRNETDNFGRETAKLRDNQLEPVSWWEKYGNLAPTLKRIAIRVLSQDCSSGPCERNWSTWALFHTKKRNRLSTTQLERLVYCNCNLQLLEKNSGHPHPSQVNVDKIDIEKVKFIPEIPQDERDIYTLLYEEMTAPLHTTRQSTHTARGRSRSDVSTSAHAELVDPSSSDPDSHESDEHIDDDSMDDGDGEY